MLKKVKEFFKNKLVKKVLLIGVGSTVAILLIFYASVYFGAWGAIPSKKELSEIQLHKATEVLASDGRLLGKFYVDDRQPIPFSHMPKHLIDALVATEDARFYEHNGVDTRSLLRVLFKSILLGNKSAGGGSTISQQLAKNLYPRKNLGKLGIIIHKIRESIIARRIEKVYSKEEVLKQYLNTVPFSDNTYGIESASKKFFSKATKDLSINEAAVLIGMLKASHNYNPRLFPERSKERRNTVLAQMVKYNYLEQEQSTKLMVDSLVLDYQDFGHNQGLAPYFRQQIRKDLEVWCAAHKTGDNKPYNTYTSGLKVHTTLDYEMQVLAEAATSAHLKKLQQEFEKDHGKNAPWLKGTKLIAKTLYQTKAYKKLKKKGYKSRQILDSLNVPHDIELFDWNGKKVVKASTIDSVRHYLKFLNAGVIAIEPKTGAVRSWVGGINYEYFQYDHVNQSKRQVGSTFKPIVYTAALENGMHPCAHIPASKVTYKNMENWAPSNSSSKIDPELRYSLKSALSKSINTIAVKVLEDTGIKRTTTMAQKMGISSPIPQVPSMALGTAELPLIELAGAYTTYVNNRKASAPFYITRIEDAKGSVLEEFKPKTTTEPAFSETTRQTMLEFMKATINEGTATRIRNKYGLKNDMAGKTGTTQDNKDGWFVAVMPKLVIATWVGTDDYQIGFRSTKYGQGAHAALPITALLLQQMNKNAYFDPITKAKFDQPSATVLQELNCPDSSQESFIKRLFSNPNKAKSKQYRDRGTRTKKRKGLFRKKKKKR